MQKKKVWPAPASQLPMLGPNAGFFCRTCSACCGAGASGAATGTLAIRPAANCGGAGAAVLQGPDDLAWCARTSFHAQETGFEHALGGGVRHAR